MENQNETFTYRYSPLEQAEVASIRDKYLPKEPDKMEQLRRLDRIPYRKAQTAALTVGILGALILGLGMSVCMTELGGFLGGTAWFVGIPIGVVGLLLVALAYPVYNRILKKQRQRIAPEILRLSEELLK